MVRCTGSRGDGTGLDVAVVGRQSFAGTGNDVVMRRPAAARLAALQQLRQSRS
jgi:hypothetical protein